MHTNNNAPTRPVYTPPQPPVPSGPDVMAWFVGLFALMGGLAVVAAIL